jgi:hypothetical protein
MNPIIPTALLAQTVPVPGVEGYGILSLCLFCVVFTGVFVWAFLQRKSHLDRMARAPLDLEPDALGTAPPSVAPGPPPSPANRPPQTPPAHE